MIIDIIDMFLSPNSEYSSICSFGIVILTLLILIDTEMLNLFLFLLHRLQWLDVIYVNINLFYESLKYDIF